MSTRPDDRRKRASETFGLVADWVLCEPMAAMISTAARHPMADGDPQVAGSITSGWLPADDELPSWLHDELTAPSVLTDSQRDIVLRTLAVERQVAADFDFRGQAGGGYRERNHAGTADFDEDTRARIIEIARELELITPRVPRHATYDMTLVLGGGYLSPLLRTRLAAQIEAAGTALGTLYSLGSPRFLISEPPEATAVAGYAPDARDEFDLMCAAAASEFGLTVDTPEFLCGCTFAATRCPSWPAAGDPDAAETPPEYTHLRTAPLRALDSSVRGSVLSAHTSRPPLRPNTSDTYELLSRVAHPHDGQRALIVTTQIFVPFQRFDGMRRLWLPSGVDIDAVGFGEEWGDRPLTAEYVLQETLSAIRSARRLLVDAVDVLRASSTMG